MQSLCESSAHNKSRQRSPNQTNVCPQNKISPKQSSATSTIHGIIIFPKTNTLCPLVPKRELLCIIIYHVVGLYQLERQVCSSMILKKRPRQFVAISFASSPQQRKISVSMATKPIVCHQSSGSIEEEDDCVSTNQLGVQRGNLSLTETLKMFAK